MCSTREEKQGVCEKFSAVEVALGLTTSKEAMHSKGGKKKSPQLHAVVKW